MNSTLVPVKIETIKLACENAVKHISQKRSSLKSEQIDLIMAKEPSTLQRILGNTNEILTREDAEKELVQYANGLEYKPDWMTYKEQNYSKANTLLNAIFFAAEGIIWLSLDDTEFLHNYLK